MPFGKRVHSNKASAIRTEYENERPIPTLACYLSSAANSIACRIS